MLHGVKKLRGCRVRASDGEIGEVREVYFDDERWVVRYLIVDTGGGLGGRKGLISPYAVRHVDWDRRTVNVDLTRQQVRESPGIDTDKPVSRQQEAELHRYYGYPAYWPYTTLWAWGAVPVAMPPDPELREQVLAQDEDASLEREHESGDSHLRSSAEVTGYHIQATDEPVGHVEDFLFDDESWAIRYFAIDTRNWLPGRHVLIATQWIDEVSWPERTVHVGLTRRQIEESPEYDPSNPPSRAYEADLHRHYRQPGYWQERR